MTDLKELGTAIATGTIEVIDLTSPCTQVLRYLPCRPTSARPPSFSSKR